MSDGLSWLNEKSSIENTHGTFFSVAASLMLVLMAILAGGAALRESVTIDEGAHIGAGVTYLQKLDLRLNEEHPPVPKLPAALHSSVAPYMRASVRHVPRPVVFSISLGATT